MEIAAPKESPVAKIKIPSWTGSILFHLFVLLVVLLYIRFQPVPPSAPGDKLASGGIMIKRESQDGTSYIDSQNNQYGEASPVVGDDEPLSAPTLEKVLSAQFSEADPKQMLAELGVGTRAATGTARNVSGGASIADSLRGGSRKTGAGYEIGGTVSTKVFNIEGKGTSFVYVFDRSGSMDEFGGKPFRAAKAELIRSIEPFNQFHKFDIIFYNEEPLVWKPAMVFATDVVKAGATKHIEGMLPMGGTRHFKALMEAIRLKPEVIFFLTDGDENDRLSPAQLQEISNRNSRGPVAQINVIQFGIGEKNESEFLKKLASQNRGQYTYINVDGLR